jgi:RNA polymerase sigma factor (sigma-70 family)
MAHHHQRVGAHRGGVLDQAVDGLAAGVLEQLGVGADLPADQALESGGHVAAHAAAAHGEPEGEAEHAADPVAGDVLAGGDDHGCGLLCGVATCRRPGTMSHPPALRVVQCMIAGDPGAIALLGRKDEGDGRARVSMTPFAQVYEAHAASVYRYCLAQLGDAHAAEDAAADAFGKAYAAWERSPDGDADGVRRWIFRIARNAAVDQRRRRRRRVLLLGRLGQGGNGAVDVETVAALRAELRAALAAVGGLGRRDRELVGLRCAGGLSYAEIAGLIGTTEDAARTATHRALRRVRAALGTEEA